MQRLRRSTAEQRFPVQGSQCTDQPVSGKSSCSKHYLTRFEIENGAGVMSSVVLAGVHLVANSQDPVACLRREAQASIIKEALETELGEQAGKLIILGDMNDMDNEVQPAYKVPSRSRALSILKSTSHAALINAASKIAQETDRYSVEWKPAGRAIERSLIDHILLSPDWRIASVQADHSDPITGPQRPSDHWPLKATLHL